MKTLTLLLLTSVSLFSGTKTTTSWYGEETEGYMANGKWFDPNALTCASWDYPFGTFLVVRERQSSRQVVVEVTDRGPAKRLYRQGRKLDLSRAAFERIGKLSDGLLEVEIVTVINPHDKITKENKPRQTP
jgi:rare lipoprotein A